MITDHTQYIDRYHAFSSIFIIIFISSFDFNLSKSLISKSKKKKLYITSHCASDLCLTHLDSISLSQKGHLHSLLNLICPSMISKIFSSILIHSIVHVSWCKLTCIPSLNKYSLWSSCIEYKRNDVWTTTKLKDKAIRISNLKCLILSLQISNLHRILANRGRIPTCVYKIKPYRNNETKT